MIDELVEIVARSDAEYDGRPFDGLGKSDKERYLGRARMSVTAQIIRLREPTKEMVVAGEVALENAVDSDYSSDADGNRHPYTYIISGSQTEIWRAMIDAAMEGK